MNKKGKTMKYDQRLAIKRHGEQLKVIFGLPIETDPVLLCKRLRRIEIEARGFALAICNGEPVPMVNTEEDEDAYQEMLLDKVDKLVNFRVQGIPVFVNMDARGYALKVDREWAAYPLRKPIYVDWGGYGIIAPDLIGQLDP